MTLREKMAAGELYIAMGDELKKEGLEAEIAKGRELAYAFNTAPPLDEEKRVSLLRELLGGVGENPWVEPPIHFSYGCNIYIGDNFYANFNLVVVDDITVKIGNNVMLGPNVTITATGHPIDPDVRRPGAQFSYPVVIEDDVWVGGCVVIMPGVTIGRNSVIGAGSVVTRDIPANVVAVGNPCRVLRPITEADKHHKPKR